jgi:hypothetical protein
MYYFVTLLFVILSGKATFFDQLNACWVIIDIIILWVGFTHGRFCKGDFRLFVKFSLVYLAFCTLRLLFFTGLSFTYWISDVTFLFKFILTGFLYCALLKEKAIYYLTKVIVDLAILSIPLYCLQLISGDLVYAVGKLINLPYPHFDGYVNFLVFTYVKVHAIRNSGFSWEPGAFGFFLIMALLMNFFINDFTFDKRAKWLTAAVVTTLSTTTYVAFIFVLLLYFRAIGVRFSKILVFVIPFLVVLASAVPFLFDKIINIYHNDMSDMKNIETLSKTYIKMGQVMPLNRFASLLFLSQTFGFKLILGISNSYQDTIPILGNISISNGIFAFCAQFGLVGLGLLLYRSFALFQKYTRAVELSLYCVLIILILGFGECIYLTPLMLAFLFLYYYADPEPILSEEPGESDIDQVEADGLTFS